ncbi:unnamed protein product [Peniophora sp. CBMAI 1063]|nr:unnamed protein product [Peniophora sp. CBMAI 1063]
MGRPARINGKRAALLLRIMPELLAIDLQEKPNGQKANEDRHDFYDNAVRLLVLCFGVANPLTNDTPDNDWFTVEYAEIPAAGEMPPLPAEEAEERDKVITSLTLTVRNFYKDKRQKMKAGEAKAILTQRNVERVVAAMAPEPKPPKELDVYQKFFKDRFRDAFDKAWKRREDEAGGDGKVLAALKKRRGGQLRVFARKRWECESADVKASVRTKCAELHGKRTETHRALWGAPNEALPNSRMWVLPEAADFFEGVLSWAAARFGVAMALTIAGPTDSGEPADTTLYAAGDSKPGAPTLSEFASASLQPAKIRLRQFARDMLTGQVPVLAKNDDAGEATKPEGEEMQEDENEEDVGLDGEDFAGELAGLDIGSGPENDSEEVPQRGKKTAGSRKSGAARTIDLEDEQDMDDIDLQLASPNIQSWDEPDLGEEVEEAHADAARAKGKRRAARADSDFEMNAGDDEYDGHDDEEEEEDDGDVDDGKGKGSAVFRDFEDDDEDIFGFGFGQLGRAAGPGWSHVKRRLSSTSSFGHGSGFDDASLNCLESDDELLRSRVALATRNAYGGTTSPSTATSDYEGRALGGIVGDASEDEEVTRGGEGTSDDEAIVDKMLEARYEDRRQKRTVDKSSQETRLGGLSRARASASRKKEATGLRTAGEQDAPVAKVGAGKVSGTREANKKGKKGKGKAKRKDAGAGIGETGAGPVAGKKRALRTASRRRITSPIESDVEGGDDGQKTIRQARSADASVGETAGEVNKACTQAWLHEHLEGSLDVGLAAWRSYSGGRNVAGSRREKVVEIIKTMAPALRVVYADLVDTMEVLLKMDELWDMGKGGHLDNASRPKAVTVMINHRGGLLGARDCPRGWGKEVKEWWLTLQPAARGVDVDIAQLMPPTAGMAWGSLVEARGYKGAFLLVWCMMHWARFDSDMEEWREVAEDMTAVFKLLARIRQSGGDGDGGSAAGSAPPSRNKRRAEDEEQASGGAKKVRAITHTKVRR